MSRIEIKADGDVEVTLNGITLSVGSDGYVTASGAYIPTAPEPDRITITLAKREAELVADLTGEFSGGHTGAVFAALIKVGLEAPFPSPNFASKEVSPRTYGNGNAYAHAERLGDTIHLTMDRDVAVTLYELLCRVDSRGELDSVFSKLAEAGAYTTPDDPDRFTGTIRWKKPKPRPMTGSEAKAQGYLLHGDLVPGEKYELVAFQSTEPNGAWLVAGADHAVGNGIWKRVE